MNVLPSHYVDNAAYAQAIGPDFLLASDLSRLSPRNTECHVGAFRPGPHPVVAPMPHVVVEAEMRLYARYVQMDWTNKWGINRSILGVTKRVVDTELISDPVLRDLFIRNRDGKFSKNTDFGRLLGAHLGEKPYVEMHWPKTRSKEQSRSTDE